MVFGTREDILKDIGERMRARRLDLNLSQRLAAARSGIGEVTLKNFEKGNGISLWGFISLCRTYGNEEWIYTLTPENVMEYSRQIRPFPRRQRASKRKESADV